MLQSNSYTKTLLHLANYILTLGYFLNDAQLIRGYSLEYLINMQDVIISQAGEFSEINKPAGCNKALQVGNFSKIICKKIIQAGKIPNSRM